MRRIRLILSVIALSGAVVGGACGSNEHTAGNPIASGDLGMMPSPSAGDPGVENAGQPAAGAGETGNNAEPPQNAGDPSNDEPVAGGDPTTADPTMGDPAMGDPTMNDPNNGLRVVPSRRGMCDLQTPFEGDDACLAPPDPSEGFQVHIGPDDYDDPAQVDPMLMQPGEESSVCYFKKLPIDQDAHYFVFELSGRPGTHHIINTLIGSSHADGWGTCTNDSVGSIGGASKPHMPPAPVAPENEGLGFPVAAHQQLQSDMHYFNFTDEPILREYWMNIYYVPEDELTQVPGRVAGLGGFSWNFSPIQPGTHQVYDYECGIDTDGRIVQLLGHTHSHGVRETAHIRRANGERIKVFEQYDYLDPQIFNYNSVTENPAFSESAPGAFSGMLEVSAGDTLEWECEVNNDSDTALRYTNEVKTGEMCNIWGTTVGPTVRCYLQ